jgi:ABC-type transporter Mla subunit MlaD
MGVETLEPMAPPHGHSGPFDGVPSALFTALALAGQLSGHATSVPGDPWPGAVAQAQALLNAHPGFLDGLRSYSSVAQELDPYLDVVDQAQPALETVDQLRAVELPLLGNAWEALCEALDLVVPGAGESIEALEAGLRQLRQLRIAASRLVNLDVTASTAAAFVQSPSRETLETWVDTCPTAIRTLEDLDRELVAQLSSLDELANDVEIARNALGAVGTAIGLNEAVADLNYVVSIIAQPLNDLRAELSGLHDQIEGDLEVLEEVVRIVERARNPWGFGLPGGAGELAAMIAVLAGASVAGGAFWFSRRYRAKLAEAQPARPASHLARVGENQGSWAEPISDARAWLAAESGPLAGQRFAVSRETTTMGRGTSADIRILDPAVSRAHARLRHAAGSWFVQDMGSAGGTFVNGERVPAARLKSGDRITIGRTKLVFWEQ